MEQEIEPLSSTLEFKNEIQTLITLYFPGNLINATEIRSKDIHIFLEASDLALSAVVFRTLFYKDNTVSVKF